MIRKNSRATTRFRRHRRNRLGMWGTSKRPRLSIFRSKLHIYAQLIDDDNSSTLVFANSLQKELKLPKASKASSGKEAERTKGKKGKLGTSPPDSPRQIQAEPRELSRPQQIARLVGQHVAQRALEKGITDVVFDRGGFKFHGRLKAVADGAREAGLRF